MFRKGYIGAGIRDIAAEAAAPHGSFTNHFRSVAAEEAETCASRSPVLAPHCRPQILYAETGRCCRRK
jgi:AcrR family transcriptional regulator